MFLVDECVHVMSASLNEPMLHVDYIFNSHENGVNVATMYLVINEVTFSDIIILIDSFTHTRTGDLDYVRTFSSVSLHDTTLHVKTDDVTV